MSLKSRRPTEKYSEVKDWWLKMIKGFIGHSQPLSPAVYEGIKVC